VQVKGVATGAPDNLQPVSFFENPEPQTWTSGFGSGGEDTWAEVGFSINGFNVTLKRRSPVEFVKIALSG
jgi:hypothetical protein